MAAKITSSSCFTFLKKALILPTLNPKLFAPVLLLFAFTAFLDPLVHVVVVMPLADFMASFVAQIKDTDPSSAEYARLMEMVEPKQVGKRLLRITIAKFTVALALSLVKQIIALFAASTTYSGDRHTLPGLLRELVNGRHGLKGASVTIAVVGALDFASSIAILLMRGRWGVLSVQGLVFLLAYLASFCFTVVALVAVAASVADRRFLGVRALRLAWRLLTRVRRTEGLVLVLAAHLLPAAVTPLRAIALGYAKSSTAACLCLLAAYALLSGAQELFSLVAATVYYYEAMETKEKQDEVGDGETPVGV